MRHLRLAPKKNHKMLTFLPLKAIWLCSFFSGFALVLVLIESEGGACNWGLVMQPPPVGGQISKQLFCGRNPNELFEKMDIGQTASQIFGNRQSNN